MAEERVTSQLKKAISERAQGCCEYCQSQSRFARIVPLYNPRQQRWSDHFAWNNDCSLVIGLSPTGWATVEVLQLNREGVVNLRRILYVIREHPPTGSRE